MKEQRLIDANAVAKLVDGASEIFDQWITGNEDRTLVPAIRRLFESFRGIIDNAPTIDAVTYSQISNVIAGHSNYHGDDILSALVCIAEGKEVKPVRPIDAVPVVRCGECKSWKRNVGMSDSPNGHCFTHDIDPNGNDYCSYGERREVDGDGQS